MQPHMLHKSCCLIIGYHFPRGLSAASLIHPFFHPAFYFFISLTLSLASSSCSSSIYLFFPPMFLISSLQSLLNIFSRPCVHLSSFLLEGALSEMATGSSVAQLGINKHLDISLLSPSPVDPFFPLTQGQRRRPPPLLLSPSSTFSVTLAV